MTTTEEVLRLAVQALDEFESVSLSASARRGLRISRLMGHASQAWLFRADLTAGGGSEAIRVEDAEAIFPDQSYMQRRDNVLAINEEWIKERTPTVPRHMQQQVQPGSLIGGSLAGLESSRDALLGEAANGQTSVKDRVVLRARAEMNDEILDRARWRAHAYLCQVEVELSFTVATQRIFDNYRSRVDLFLRQVSSSIFDQFAAAYRRVQEGDIEARSHALTSCRRILKSVADVVYPVPIGEKKTVVGKDGKPHELTDDRYVARLWQFLSGSYLGGTVSDSMHATLADVGNRIDKLYSLTNKGVHVEITTQEVEWCVIQTYLLAGEVLTVHSREDDLRAESNSQDLWIKIF